MVKIYSFKNDTEWTAHITQQRLLQLPSVIKDKITNYKSWQERQARIISKCILQLLLADFGIPLTLADMSYTSSHKPFFDTDFHFSTAHSADIVTCVGSLRPIGIDIELISPLDLDHYQDYLTGGEWQYIYCQKDKLSAFYKLWTKKEALLKASGHGLDIALNDVDVRSDQVIFRGNEYRFKTLPLADGYIAHIATSAPFYNDAITFERLSALPLAPL